MDTFTSPEQFEESYTTLFKTFDTGKTKNLAWRKWQLKQCWWMIVENEAEIIRALKADLNRPLFEVYGTDLRGVKEDVLAHIEHLEEWTADDIPDAGFILGTVGKARVRKEPLGVALIIGAWNFPFVLNFCPLFSAIAAGCCAMVKPSELAPVSQNLIAELVSKYLDSDAIRVVTGGPKETSSMLERKYNQIFYTGSSKVARYVTTAAAKHLTPVVLELGGQGPAIVTSTADIDLAAKRVAFGKHLNAGQICLSPNHTFVHPDVHDKFVERLQYWSGQFLGDSTDDITHIINERNFDRLSGLLDKTNGKVVYGGKRDRKDKFFGPTVVTGVDTSGKPTIIYINNRANAYIAKTVIENTISGGVTVNDVALHCAVPNAPFGGVGESGYGYYHGKYGFLAFTHLRTIVSPPNWLDRLLNFRYPPYNMSNVNKIAIKNHLGFKRGETMADQKIKSKSESWDLVVMAVKFMVLAVAIATMDNKMGGKSRLLEMVMSPVRWLRKMVGF